MKETWLRTDEREDILASLRIVNSSCTAAVKDLSAWKWIVIGTHSALQGVMALHLGFGNDLLVASPEDAAAWLDAHENGAPYPEMMMDDFLNLYKKLKKHEILGYRLKPNGTQGDNIRRLNRFRNQLVHFMPQGWSIELSGMPAVCLDCLDVAAQVGEHSLCIDGKARSSGNHSERYLANANRSYLPSMLRTLANKLLQTTCEDARP